jgi:predicted RNase H-like HicB family nuclease
MDTTRTLTALIEKEGDMYVALCPELDIASQGYSVEEAKHNLKEALELFFEEADDEEIKSAWNKEVLVTHVHVRA